MWRRLSSFRMCFFAFMASSERMAALASVFFLCNLCRMGACLSSIFKTVSLICTANLSAERLSETSNDELMRSLLKEDQSIELRFR